MNIAVTFTGKDDKQLLYHSWLKKIAPSAEQIVFSYDRKMGKDLERCDGLVLTGGADVDPVLYGQSVGECTKGIDRQRDEFEFSLIEYALKFQKPILGICRGLQVANVYFSGTLYQDLSTSGFQNHVGEKDVPGIDHTVNIITGTLISGIVKSDQGTVNSFHHQGVDRIGKELIASGHSPDNVVESMEWREKSGKPFLLLVQWHPERMKNESNPFVDAIGRRFINEIQKTITI